MSDVVITGIGVVTPIGCGRDELWDSLMSGRSGTAPIRLFDASSLPVKIAAEVKEFDAREHMEGRDIARSDRFTHLAMAAASMALADSGAREAAGPERTGVIVGSGIGGLNTIEEEHDHLTGGGPRRVSPFMVPKLMPNAAAGMIAMKYGFLGPNFAPASACATGAHAVGEAMMAIRNGRADVMLAGGSEAAITPLSVSAFARMGALSRRNDDPGRASRPFDAQRDGFVFGEGAGVLVLERADAAAERGAHVYARVAGYGASADAYHVTQPDPQGAGAERAMREALRDARLDPDAVDYINAHGTSTPYNDKVETIAIKRVFGTEAKRIPVSSTKSQTGHLLGAAGAVEAAVCALSIERGIVAPTVNLEEPDPECDLDYVPEGPREAEVRVALSNSFGFGGQNACLVITSA